MGFADRIDAGRRLAELLTVHRGEGAVVLALPRGGVPIGREVASALGCPLDVLVVRKVGHPHQPELGVGAVGEGGISVLNDDLLARTGLEPADLRDTIERETREVERRISRYRGDRARVDVTGRTAIVVDDGLATGFTARAAVDVVRRLGAERVVVAVPVAPAETVVDLRSVADEVVAVETPAHFYAIGEHYRDFHQLTDVEVVDLLG